MIPVPTPNLARVAPLPPAPAGHTWVHAAGRFQTGLGRIPVAARDGWWHYHTGMGWAPIPQGPLVAVQRGNQIVLAKGMGQVKANYQAPTSDQVSANPPGQALLDAGSALQAYVAANGVPVMTTPVAAVTNFQSAWNADPLGQVNGNNSTLNVDGEYGPNTHDAYASIYGSAWPVNYGTSPAPAPSPAPSSTPSAAPSWWTSMSTTEKVAVGGAGLIAAALVGSALIKKHGKTVTHHTRRVLSHGRAHIRRYRHA